MRRPTFVASFLTLAVLAPIAGIAETDDPARIVRAGGVTVTFAPGSVSVQNGLVRRTWSDTSVTTLEVEDLRSGATVATAHPDFALVLDGARITSDLMPLLEPPTATALDDGVRLTWHLVLPEGAEVRRTVELYAGIAGFRSQTTIVPLVPLALSGYTMDELAVGASATPTLHALRAGADWRHNDPAWNPPSYGDPHLGEYHVATPGATGEPLSGFGEWLSVGLPSGGRAGLISERRNYASSQLSYDGMVATALVDLSRDVIYFGPIEESGHIENPNPTPARHRAALPSKPLVLEPGFTVVGEDADDEPWQFHKYLQRLRPGTTDRRVIFNTDKTDSNKISTGVKDDVDFTRFLSLAAAAREMGVDTFVFDDGWQAASGDWCPDSPGCPDPRNRPGPYSRSLDENVRKYPDRFPDDHFGAVREVLENHNDDPSDDIRLGLWFTPMEFHPGSKAFETNPQWACLPVGAGTAALSVADPNGGSNEAGIGVWNPLAMGVNPDDPTQPMRLIDYIEGRIRRAIVDWEVSYFKFDFLVWVDCGGAEPVDMYGYRDAFVGMLDELIADFPHVTFTIDETNDYRMFPYESITRGATWFQNGTPSSSELLQNLWNLGEWVPGSTIGQAALGNGADRNALGVDRLMAVALGSHLTFWTAIDTNLSPAQRAQVKKWTDFYHQNAALLSGVTYPLLEEPFKGRDAQTSPRPWTALQRWDRDAQRGFLLAYRQKAENVTQSVPLRGLTAGTYRLTSIDPATGTVTDLGTADAQSLRTSGVQVGIADEFGYAIVKVERI